MGFQKDGHLIKVVLRNISLQLFLKVISTQTWEEKMIAVEPTQIEKDIKVNMCLINIGDSMVQS